MKNKTFYTEMALDAVELQRLSENYNLSVQKAGAYITKTRFLVKTAEQSKSIGKRKGLYYTFDTDYDVDEKTLRKDLAREIKTVIREMTAEVKKSNPVVMVVGLGNRHMAADSLGEKVLSELIVTRHIIESGVRTSKRLSNVCGIAPGVFGVTGIESADIIKGTVTQISADIVIAVDTLATAKAARLFKSFQITDSGIEPGSGAGNRRPLIDREFLGVPVISVGVPLALYARSILYDCLSRVESAGADIGQNRRYAIIEAVLGAKNLSMVLAPKEVDLQSQKCAEIIAAGINLAFQNISDKKYFES